MTPTIHLGISTCPNDTFAFHALMERQVDWRGLNFQVTLLDVQALNDRCLTGQFDVAKVSFHAALMMAEKIWVLPSGSALGFGVGPLLLSRHAGVTPAEFESQAGRSPIVLCPGETTTATLLYRLFGSNTGTVRQVVFSEIMPALQRGQADFGVCIHEGRFTWRESGLYLVRDLGEAWEEETGIGLPLGGIVARRELGRDVVGRIQRVVRDSIEFGLNHRQEPLPTMRQYAAEFDDAVLYAHVDLYVNDQTVDLGSRGRQALAKLSQLATTSATSANQPGPTYGSLEEFQARVADDLGSR